MSHRTPVPQFHMHEMGPGHLRERGIAVIDFMTSVHVEPARLRPHVHPFYQMYWLQGNASVMLDFKEHEVHGNTVVCMSPGQVHTVAPKSGLRGITISFTREFFDDSRLEASKLLQYAYFLPEETHPLVSLKTAAKEEVLRLFHQLLEEYQRGWEDSEDLLRASLQLLLLRLRRLHQPKENTSLNRALQLARAFQHLVEKHFATETSIAFYAQRLGISVNHLHDCVHEQLRVSAGDLIRRRRLLHAKRLLLHSHMDVAGIGYDLGFQDPSYFTRFFRRYERITPTQFRDKIREKYQ